MKHFESPEEGTIVMGADDRPEITVQTAPAEVGTELIVTTTYPTPYEVKADVDSDDPEVVAALAEELGRITEDMRTDLYRKGRFVLRLGQIYTRPEQNGMGRAPEGQEAVLRIEPPIQTADGIAAIAFGPSKNYGSARGDIHAVMSTSEATLLNIGHRGLGQAALTIAMERLGNGLDALDTADMETLTDLTQNPEPRFTS